MSTMVLSQSGPKKYECVSNGSFNTVRTPIPYKKEDYFLCPKSMPHKG